MSVNRTELPLPSTVLVLLPCLLAAACGPTSDAGGAAGSHDGSQARPEAALRLAEEPALLIGVQEGLDEYVLHNIDGAAALTDGSVAVGVTGSHEIRKYDS